MNVADHLDRLQEHGRCVEDAARRAGLDAPVATCPKWQVRDVVAHLGQVQRWATEIVRDTVHDPRALALGAAPADDGLLDWYADGLDALVAALSAAPDDLDCWTFLAAPSSRAFWARRQAHEASVHRLDLTAAAGIVTTTDPRFAVDGIDELLLGFFARPRGRLVADPPVVLGVECVDGAPGDAWTVRIRPNDREITRGVARGDCVVRGGAAALYAFLWNRSDGEHLDVTGDRRALELWQAKAQVTWR